MNKPIEQLAPVATVSTPTFIGRLTCAFIAPDSEREAEITGLIAHIDTWQRDVTAQAVAEALEGQLAELSHGGALYQPDAWSDAWHDLRADVLSGVDGLDNDQVNTVLGMLDNYEPSPAVSPAAQASAPVAVIPDGWRLVEKKTHYQLNEGRTVVACLSGPDAESNAAIIARALAAPRQHAQAAPPFASGAMQAMADAGLNVSVGGEKVQPRGATGNAQAALSDDHVFSIADAHADESREDGVRLLDRGGLLAFAADILATRQPAPIVSAPTVAVPYERMQNWIDLIHDNERSMGDRLQTMSSTFAGLLRGDAVDKYPLRVIREQQSIAAPPAGAVAPTGFVLVPEYPTADAVVSALYRRFKEWSKRGFGPADVTWCEVKADIAALVAAQCPADAAPVDAKPVDGLLAALKDISEACNCCGDRHDLAQIACDALEAYGGEIELSRASQFEMMNHRLAKTFSAQPSKAQGDALSQPIYFGLGDQQASIKAAQTLGMIGTPLNESGAIDLAHGFMKLRQPGSERGSALREVHAFLLGEAPLCGLWFGAKPEFKEPFWWRSHLRSAMTAQQGEKGESA